MRNNYTWKIEKIKWEHNVEGHKNKNLELEWVIQKIMGIYLTEKPESEDEE